RQRSRHHQLPFSRRQLDHLQIQPRAHQELRSCIKAPPRHLRIQHLPRSDENFRPSAFCEFPNDFYGPGNRHRDFHDRNPALTHPPPRNPCSHPFHHLHHFRERNHRSVARRGHGQRSVRRPTLHGPLRLLPRQKSVDQAGRKRIASPHAIKNLQVLSILRLVKLLIAITNRAPIIQRRGFGFSQSRRYHFKCIVLHDLANHLLESFDFKRRNVLVHPWHFIPQRRRKILFIPEHHINVWRNPPVHFLSLLLAAQRF